MFFLSLAIQIQQEQYNEIHYFINFMVPLNLLDRYNGYQQKHALIPQSFDLQKSLKPF